MGIDVVCFTGHKSLMGPQGTGGLCLREGLEIRPFTVGGVQTRSSPAAPGCPPGRNPPPPPRPGGGPGAHLTCKGSGSLEDLKSLEAQGVEILTCGTCLNFFGLTDKLQGPYRGR